MRNIVKVVHNYICYLEPVEDRGPYDIVSTALCLEYVCMTNDVNRESITEEACLVKHTGSSLFMLADENVPSWGIPSKMFNVNPISTEFV